MFKNLLNKLAGNPYEREINRYRVVVAQVNEQEKLIRAELGIPEQGRPAEISEHMKDILRGRTATLRTTVAEATAGIEEREELVRAERAALESALPEAFALVRIASHLSIGLRPYDVQIVGGIVLHEGRIAEMKTGEGKTLVATLPLFLNALAGRGAHLVTVNDYLARRDGGWMGPIYHLLGMTTAVIGKDTYSAVFDPDFVDPGGDLEDERLVHWRPIPRRECYRAEITYGTAAEFGFDYLRDNIATDSIRTVQRGHAFAIVDEVDSVLIDSARTPLIISGPAEKAADAYVRFAKIVEDARLKRNTSDLKEEEPNGDYVLDDRTQSVSLTERGIEKIEKLLPEIDIAAGQSIYDPAFFELVPYLENALKARYLFHRDKQYMVQQGQVILIDQTTGRAMPSRRYSEGLHQAIEAKEGVAVQRENVTIATITVQNYFRMYDKLCGMTGTAVTQAEEFDEVYKLDVVPIPTNVEYRSAEGQLIEHKQRDPEENVPVISYSLPGSDGSPAFFKRTDYPDQVYQTVNSKFNAVVQEIAQLVENGRPILVGTGSVEASEVLSQKLKKAGVPHEVLNAKNNQREALIVAQAGRPGAVTISTNMAGRGTDILLGGNPEGLSSKLVAEKCFNPQALQRVVSEVVRSGLEAGRKIARSERFMSEEVADWVDLANADLVRRAQVEDVLQQVVQELREDSIYAGISFDTMLAILQQLELASLDPRRAERAQQMVEEQRLPASLIPEMRFRVDRYRSVKGLLGQAGHIETLTQQLMEQHYNARAALVRAVLANDLDEARLITGRVPALPASLIDDVQALRMDCESARHAVWQQGGLHVIGTERHEARRIDDQLRGRAARQGDPGSSRFYLSLEDELMMRFGGDRTKGLMERFNIPEDMPIAANILSNAIETSQGRFETYNFEIRKNLIEYDEAVNRQREIVYEERRAILDGSSEDLDAIVRRFMLESIEAAIARYRDGFEDWTISEIESVLEDFSNLETGEVNARGALGRLQGLFPRLQGEELEEVQDIDDTNELRDTLIELVRDGIGNGYHIRILQAEVNRIVPIWPVAPAIDGNGAISGWEDFMARVREVAELYTAAIPAERVQPVEAALIAGLESGYREALGLAGRGLRPDQLRGHFYGALGQQLEATFNAILNDLSTEELIEVLEQRIDDLLNIARQPSPENRAEASPERVHYSIGEEELQRYARALMLQMIDHEWRQYLTAIDDLRQGIGLEAYGQRDPKIQFKRRAFEMFEALRADVRDGVSRRFFWDLPRHRQYVESQQRHEALLDRLAQQGYRVDQKRVTRGEQVQVQQTIRKDIWANVGRNDPCPCGSGKKFKDCHLPQLRQQQTSPSTGSKPGNRR